MKDGVNPELKAASDQDLKALCLALLDNLNDRSLALSHQKQTNRLLAAKIGTLEQKIGNLSGDSSRASLLTPSQLLLDNYASAKVDEDLRLSRFKKELSPKNGASSESSKSLVSSEFETQSMSDMSSELKQLNYIKIIYDDDELNDCEEDFLINNDFEPNGQLAEFPPDMQKLVDEAMKSSESLESAESVKSYQCDTNKGN